MRHILKYPLRGSGRVGLSLPAGSKLLTAQLQRDGFHDVLQVWAEVPDGVTRMENFEFFIVQTGDVLPTDPVVGQLHYFTTIQQFNGIVWHVYQIK